LVYDVSSHSSFRALPTFLNDARALASPNLTVILAGNKADLGEDEQDEGDDGSIAETVTATTPTASSFDSRISGFPTPSQASLASSVRESSGLGTRNTATIALEGREVLPEEASRWASAQGIPVAVEVSALTGENIDEVFSRLAGMILTKIELGEINPDDPQSGIQYGDSGAWAAGSDGGSIKSVMTVDDGLAPMRRRRAGRSGTSWMNGLREWEEVFRLDGRRRNRCC
jgi:GTPase SAR1 family protein